jgi:hypothetical protein
MKKLFCMIALGAISFGSVMAAAPVSHATVTAPDSAKAKKKVKVKKDGTYKMKSKKKDSIGGGN